MRGQYGRQVTWSGAEPQQPAKSPSTLPVTLLIMAGLTAAVVAVLRDEARASR